MMPLNLKDPASGDDYFTAAGKMIRAAEAPAASTAWRRFPTGRTCSPTPRSMATRPRRTWPLFMENAPDCSRRSDRDQFCYPGVYPSGAFYVFNSSTDSLAAQSSSPGPGTTRCNSPCASGRARDTSSTSTTRCATRRDHGSAVEAAARSRDFDTGGYSGFDVNTWIIEKQ